MSRWIHPRRRTAIHCRVWHLDLATGAEGRGARKEGARRASRAARLRNFVTIYFGFSQNFRIRPTSAESQERVFGAQP
jgi:hypothetical protein